RRPFAPAQPTVRRRDALRDVHVERETIVLHGDRVPRTRGRHFPPPPPRTPRPALPGPRAAPPDVRARPGRGPGADGGARAGPRRAPLRPTPSDLGFRSAFREVRRVFNVDGGEEWSRVGRRGEQ